MKWSPVLKDEFCWSEGRGRKSATGASHLVLESVMTTIPTRLARATLVSGSLDIARARSRTLYREWYRAVRAQALTWPGV